MFVDGHRRTRVRETQTAKSKHLGAASQPMSWPTSGRSRDGANRVTRACGNFVEQPLGVALGHSPSVETQHFILLPQNKIQFFLAQVSSFAPGCGAASDGNPKTKRFRGPPRPHVSSTWRAIECLDCRSTSVLSFRTLSYPKYCTNARPRPERGPSSCCARHKRMHNTRNTEHCISQIAPLSLKKTLSLLLFNFLLQVNKSVVPSLYQRHGPATSCRTASLLHSSGPTGLSYRDRYRDERRD